MFRIRNAGFNAHKRVANLIVPLALIALASPCALAKINPAAASLAELQGHLATLEADSEREQDICLCQQYSDPYAIAICKAENLTEKGKFKEAASVLAYEAQKWASPRQQTLIQQRLGILKKWAREGQEGSEGSAGLMLAAGNAFYESGNTARAIEVWHKIISEPLRTPEWPKAVYNLGQGEQNRGNFRLAIRYFDLLLESHPNDKEPGQNIMEPYRNYSHRAALQLSLCNEKLGDFTNALRYARLAKTNYPYHSWCGTCIYLDAREVDKRIAYLLARRHPLTFALIVALCLNTLLF